MFFCRAIEVSIVARALDHATGHEENAQYAPATLACKTNFREANFVPPIG